MPSKHHRPAALQRRSTSGSNTKLTLSNLNLQKLDSSSNLQLQVALNNAAKDLPRGKGKKSTGRPNQPPSRTESDQQIKPPSKLHLQHHQPHPHRPATGAPRPALSQKADTTTATKSNKKSGFTLTSPLVAAHDVDAEGDSDEWVSSESLSATPQNQSSDSESDDEDDDVVHNMPAHLTLTGTTHIATSPDDREPPTPTVPQVRMQPPTPVNRVKEGETSCRLSPTVPNEAGTSADVDSMDRHDRERTIISSADDYPDAVAVRHLGHESDGDSDYPHSNHHPRPEEGLASTPRPRAILDRDTESSRHLPPDSHSRPPHSDPSSRKPPVVNPGLSGGVKDRSQRRTLSTHSVPQPHPHLANDSSPGPKAGDNPQGRDHITMTQHQQQHQQHRSPTPIRRKNPPVSSPPSPTHHRDKTKSDLSQAKHSGTTTKRSGPRPPSLYSLQPGKTDLPTIMTRPHPLIRGPSPMTPASPSPNPISPGDSNGSTHQNGVSTIAFGSGVGKLAPLTTLTALPSVSPSPPNLSPVSLKQKGKDEDEVKERLRRQSIASVSSLNTQRSLGRAAGYEYTNQGSGFRNPQRERTLSTLSSSSYAALSALYPSYNQHSTPSQFSPKSPGAPSHPVGPACGFTSYFPSMEGDNVGLGGPVASELMHMLLPAPYLSAHMTVLKGRSPIREAVERVSRARKAQAQ